jgi:hypothetical protein
VAAAPAEPVVVAEPAAPAASVAAAASPGPAVVAAPDPAPAVVRAPVAAVAPVVRTPETSEEMRVLLSAIGHELTTLQTLVRELQLRVGASGTSTTVPGVLGMLQASNRRRGVAMALGATGITIAGCLLAALALSYH